MRSRKIYLPALLLLAAALATPAAGAADDRVEILVLSVPDRAQIATVEPGETLQLSNGEKVRLRMSFVPQGRAARYPSARFRVISGGDWLQVDAANEEVGNFTMTGRMDRGRGGDAVVRYEILDHLDQIPRSLQTGTIRVEVRRGRSEPAPEEDDDTDVGFRGAILYEHEDFQGRRQNITTQVPSLRGTVIGNDTASSIRIQPGCRATLYEHEDFRGRSFTVTVDVRALRLTGIGNDTVSSVALDCTEADRRNRRR